MGVEDLNDFGEVGQRTSQPINLVDNNDLDLPCLNVREQPLQSRPLHRAARVTAVVVHAGKGDPSRVPLAPNVSLASLPLRVERIELLLETLLGGFRV